MDLIFSDTGIDLPEGFSAAFTPREERLAALARALSHPARLAILRLLADRGTCVCGQVVDALPLAQATVSQHLKVLKEAGLVRGTASGPRSCYCVDAAALAAAQRAFDGFFTPLVARGCTCADGPCEAHRTPGTALPGAVDPRPCPAPRAASPPPESLA